MASPTAVPTIPLSASGVSRTRCSPKSFCRESVTRNTPPSLPTSSPMIRTLSSDSRARRSPRLRARAIVRLCTPSAIDRHLLEAREVGRVRGALLLHQRVSLGVDLREHGVRLRLRHGTATLAQTYRQGLGLGLQPVEESLVDDLLTPQERPQPLEGVLELPGLELGRQAVARGVV